VPRCFEFLLSIHKSQADASFCNDAVPKDDQVKVPSVFAAAPDLTGSKPGEAKKHAGGSPSECEARSILV